MDAGTEGQVGRHVDADGHRGYGRGSAARRGERTRGRGPGLAVDRLAVGGGRRTATAAAHLHGIAGGGPQAGPQPAEVDAALPRQRTAQRAAGRAAQRRAWDGGHRRQDRAAGTAEGRTGRLGAAGCEVVDAQARPARVYPEGRAQQAAPTRHPGDRGQSPAGCDRQCAGAGVGGAVRVAVLRIPTRPRLPRRDRGDLQGRAGPQPHPAMGPRRRPGRGIRRSTTPVCSTRSAHSPPGTGSRPG